MREYSVWISALLQSPLKVSVKTFSSWNSLELAQFCSSAGQGYFKGCLKILRSLGAFYNAEIFGSLTLKEIRKKLEDEFQQCQLWNMKKLKWTHRKLHKTSGDSFMLPLPCSASAACTRSWECCPAVLSDMSNICYECFILSFILSLGKELCISFWKSSVVVGWSFGEGLEIYMQVHAYMRERSLWNRTLKSINWGHSW